MKITPCRGRTIVNSCSLENFDYQVDPYIGCEHGCAYCYVLPQAETDWSEEVLVHAGLGEQLEKELSPLAPQTIYMGWHTDPYQPCEAECRQTRQVLELLGAKGFSASILTKSDLVLRDADILGSMPDAAVSVSVAFTDERVRQLLEARTPTTAARIDALQQLKAAGIRTAALICPVIPYLTDVTALIERLTGAADKIWIYRLSILDQSDANWRNVADIVERHFADLKTRIENAVFSRDHAYWKELRQALLQLQNDGAGNLSIHI